MLLIRLCGFILVAIGATGLALMFPWLWLLYAIGIGGMLIGD
jgi:hypothetical protein